MSALLRKEGREHWRFLLVLYLAGAGMFVFAWIQARSTVSPLSAWHALLVGFGTPAAILLPNRLVMREYGLGTQLFLESLPLGRGTVLLTKWLAGWTGLMLFFIPAFGLVLFGARHQVYVDAGLAGRIALRSVAYLAFVYAAAFAIALTLRFRFFLWGFLFLCIVLADNHLQLPMAQWPPFLVAGVAMVLEGARPPWREIVITAALAGGLLALALIVATSTRGALVVVLARRLSAGARTWLAVGFGAVLSLFSLLDKREQAPPFHLAQAVSSATAPVVHVGWQGDIGGVAPARLAAAMSADLAAMQAWLGLRPLAALSLVPDAWRDAHELGFAKASPGQLVVRAALGAPDLALAPLQEIARIAQILDQSPAYQWREDRTWLLRGFSAWWQAQRTDGYAALLQRRADFAAQVLRAQGLDDATALRRSDTTDELLGDCLAAGYAWRAVQTLHERLGPQRFQALLRAALAQPTTDDVRSLVRVAATEDLLEQAGLPLARLAQLQGDLRRAALPAPATLRVQPARLGGDLFELRYRIDGVLPPNVAVRYKVVQPAEMNVQPEAASYAGAGPDGVLPATFAGGARVFVMAEADDPALGCRIRLGAVRAALP